MPIDAFRSGVFFYLPNKKNTILPLLFLLFSLMTVAAQQKERNELNPAYTKQTIKPGRTSIVNAQIPEASGLALWNGQLWTHNDGGHKAALFALDTATLDVVAEYRLPGIKNRDFEDLAQDEDYFYLGDIGNNSGDTDTLRIHRIIKKSLLDSTKPAIETTTFVWPETVIDGVVSKTNFNCEAMAAIGDSLYLFTKEYKTNRRTQVFSVPKEPGLYTAHYKSTLNTRILITGAYHDAVSNSLTLCGYNRTMQPYLLVFAGYKGTDFFSADAKKIRIKRRFRQVEGIAGDGTNFFVISEYWKYWFLRSKGRLYKIRPN